ncbi:CoA pyrophosphatase [Lysobacter soli]|uniref:CoA pyrophosphatase n=1 Tax=Lysobacter soli TaxID=453783 RepID=A0A3D8VJM1_9GAMM|nr:CoA pyrophosphatase [Lysobacter soli]
MAASSALTDWPDLASALHPLNDPPHGPGWNLAELHDLVPNDAVSIEAAVLVGLVPREEGTHVLLTRRTDALRQHAGQVSFPGGRIEPDDSDAVAAALRETHEEIGVGARQIHPLGFLDPLATITGYRVQPVVAVLASDYVAHPDPNEVADVFEVPLAFLLDPANLATHTLDFRGRPREVFEYRYPAQRIWGATASMLYNLRQRLEAIR